MVLSAGEIRRGAFAGQHLFESIVIAYPALERWKNDSVGGFALP